MKKTHLLFIIILTGSTLLKAQSYDVVIKGGHVIDPKNNINSIMDIGIRGDKIAEVAANIDSKDARQVVNAKRMYVTPGLVDIHVHVFQGPYLDQQYMNGPNSVMPDGFTFRNGVTTVVDAGSSGMRTFPLFKRQVIDISQTRVLAFLNIVAEGMRGGPFEQNIKDMNAQRSAEYAIENSDYIVGIKLAHFSGRDWTPVEIAEEAAKLADMPLMVDFGSANPALSLDTLFNHVFRPGDIYTHCFGGSQEVLETRPGGREAIVNLKGEVKPYVWIAKKKGILFDVGYGGASFNFVQAIPAIKAGFYPDHLGTDLHIGSMNSSMKNMPDIMSKFLLMGMDLQSVIKASTWSPSVAIKRPDLGNLSVGTDADIAIFSLRQGEFGFYDMNGFKMKGNQRFECEMTIRAGRIVYDLNGIADPIVVSAKR
jgi:dihydroorotase